MTDYMNVYEQVQIGTALETFYYTSIGKFYIGTLTPTLSGGSPYDTTIPAQSQSNIINKPSLPISPITTSNYIELRVPIYMVDVQRVPNDSNYIIKGATVQIEFVGGDINRPRVIGAY